MAKKVCDFCLSEGKGPFNQPVRLPDGHYICKNCRKIIKSYDLPLKYDLFQMLVTAQDNMVDMIMDAYLEKNNPDDTLKKFYPLPRIAMHEGEHCINAVPASYQVDSDQIPDGYAVRSIKEVRKKYIHNIPDGKDRRTETVKGILYESEAALYFMSEHIVNCHRLGYIQRNTGNNEEIAVVTPTKKFTYSVDHSDLFFMRERFYQKVNAAKNNKQEHLIYIKNEGEIRITPGVYDIPRSLRPGMYKVKAVNDAGLHIRDSFGRVTDYYENEDAIDLSAGGTLECTGEYELEWIGEKKK